MSEETTTTVGRPRKRLTSPERWEVTQLIKAGVLDVTEYPTFDEEGQVSVLSHPMTPKTFSYCAEPCAMTGMLATEVKLRAVLVQGLMHVDDDVEEEFEIDINDEEPEFLKGQSTKSGVEVSPVKIVANPDGSLQVRPQPLPLSSAPSIYFHDCYKAA